MRLMIILTAAILLLFAIGTVDADICQTSSDFEPKITSQVEEIEDTPQLNTALYQKLSEGASRPIMAAGANRAGYDFWNYLEELLKGYRSWFSGGSASAVV